MLLIISYSNLNVFTQTNSMHMKTINSDAYCLFLCFSAPPKIKTKMQDASCMTDQPFKMTVEVEGAPSPEVKWYYNYFKII